MATKDLRLFLDIAIKGTSKTLGELRQIKEAAAGLKKAGEQVGQQEIEFKGQGDALQGVAQLAFGFNNVVQAVQSLAAAAKPAYEFLIGANERLNEQILKSQTNLASATRIFQGDQLIADPTAAIQATAPAIQAAIKQIAKDTEALVGVTDTQVNEFFDSTLQNASQLINQSKQFADPIKSATALTKGFAASFKVAGLEAGQIQSEIRAILTGEELDNSTLAKSLQINRQQIQAWRDQGVLVDELNESLQVFVAGNAIAAKSISGVASNIQSLIDRVGRTAGEPLLAPTIQALSELEQFLNANEQAITDFFGFFTEGAVDSSSLLTQRLQPAIEGLIDFAEEGAGLAQNLFTLATEGAENLAAVIGPVLGFALERTAKAAQNLSDIVQTIQFREISEQVEALEAYGRASNLVTDEALKTGQALKSLNEIQENGGKLTTEQTERQKQLEAQAKLQVQAIDDQIAALKDLAATTPEIQRARNQEIASLERVKEALAAQSQQIRIEGKEAERLGTSYEQLATKAKGAAQAIGRAQTTQEASKAAKELLEALEQQVELGQITAAQAEEQLDKIANNARLEVDIQQQAQGQIAKIRKAELDRQVGDIQAQIAKVEAAEASGTTGPIEAAKEITRLKRQELDLQLADVRRAIAAEQAAISQGRGSKNNLSELQAQQTELQAKLAQEAIAAEERSQQAQIQVVERGTQKRLTVASLAETKANAEADKLRRQGAISSEEAEQRKLAATQKRIQSELQAERDKLTALQSSGPLTNPNAEAERQNKILEGQKRLVELQASLDDSRAKSAEAAYQTVEKAAERANRQIAQSEQNREIETQQLVNKGLLNAEDAERRKLQSTETRIRQELALEQERIRAIAQSGLDPEAKERLEREAKRRTADLTLQLLQNQAQQEQQLRQQILATVQRGAEQRQLAETQAQTELQRQINQGALTAEQAEGRKLQATRQRLNAQLQAEQQTLQQLQRLPQTADNQAAILAAEQRIAQARLQLAEQVATEQAARHQRSIAQIQDEEAAQQRSYDAQLNSLADVNAARARAVTAAESASQREVAALEAAGNALQRQNDLLNARASLQQARAGLQQTETDIRLQEVTRAAQIQQQLEQDEKLSAQERVALERELGTLKGAAGKGAIALLQEQQSLEDRLAQQKLAALKQEQAQAQAQLQLDNQRNALAATRAVLEAKINQLKADAALLDAQAAAREQQINSQKQIGAARSQLQQAQQQQPGRERDQAVAQAQSQLQQAQAEAQRNQAAAQQQIQLAQQQAELSRQSTQEAEAAKAQQTEIARLSKETLDAQQQQALAQAQATEKARENAQVLALAKAEAEAIASAAEREAAARERAAAAAARAAGGGAAPRGRYTGGPVAKGRAYIVGEYEPEIFVPNVSGTILNQAQIARNLEILQAAQAAAHGQLLRSAVGAPPLVQVSVAHGQQPPTIQQKIDARVNNTFVNSTQPIHDAANYALEMQRAAIARGRLR